MNHKKFLNYCISHLDLNKADNLNNYFSSVPLCAIDAIFSINTKYEAVYNSMNHFCTYFDLLMTHAVTGHITPIAKQKSVSTIYHLIKDIDSNTLVTDIFQNRQRTSTTNGILKAEASVRFLKILKDFRVEYYQDVPKLIINETFEACVKRIPGQGMVFP